MYAILDTKAGEFVTVEVDNEDAVAAFASESAAFTYIECMEDAGTSCVPYVLPDIHMPVVQMDD